MNTIKKLHEAIKEHCGIEDISIMEAAEHGASAGFCGFIYYSETVEFYDKNHSLIWDLLNEECEDMGYDNPEAMIASFNGASSVCDEDTRKNLLSWYALEQVGNWLTNNPFYVTEEA